MRDFGGFNTYHRSILQVSLRVTLLGVNEGRELDRVADEENGRVVVNPVPVSLLGVELDRETSGITSRIGRALLTTNSRETGKSLGLLADLVEHVDGGDIANVMGDLEL